MSAGNHIIATTLSRTADADENRAFNKPRHVPRSRLRVGISAMYPQKVVFILVGEESPYYIHTCGYIKKGWLTLIIHG